MSTKAEQYIDELRHTTTVASLNYDIWWVYRSADTRPLYVDVMNKYGIYFQTAIHAHFIALIIELYRLYETRDDTFNIPSLLRLMRLHSQISEEKLCQLETTLKDEAKPIWIKVNILRNKVFGHRSKAHTTEEAFSEAGMAPNELGKLLEVTKKLLNELTLEFNNSFHAFNLGSREQALQLLNDLKVSRDTSV
jgi:hypothetical protein